MNTDIIINKSIKNIEFFFQVTERSGQFFKVMAVNKFYPLL